MFAAGGLGVLFLRKPARLDKSISMLGPGDRGPRGKRLVARAVAVPRGPGRLSIGTSVSGAAMRENADPDEAAVTWTAALGAFKALPQTGASSRKLASALLEYVPRLQIVRHPVGLA